jgi:hypothetical protein
MQHIHTNEEDDIINLKSKYSDLWNICNDGIDNDIGDVSYNSYYKHIKYWKMILSSKFWKYGFTTSSKSIIMDGFEL